MLVGSSISKALGHSMPRHVNGRTLYPPHITCRTNGARLKISPDSISTSLVFIPVFSQHQGFFWQWQRPLLMKINLIAWYSLEIDFNSSIPTYWVSSIPLFCNPSNDDWCLLFFVSTPYEITIGGFWFYSCIYYLKWEHAKHACLSTLY